MTLAQAKKIIRFLLDNELYCQYENKLNTYLDMGQKRIACTTDFLEADQEIEQHEPTQLDLEKIDPRFYRLHKVEGGEWERISPTRIFLEKGKYHLYYHIYPTSIDQDTEDGYEFEISEFAQTALPYYAAAQVTIAEHDQRYHQAYNDEFAAILENVAQARKVGNIHCVLPKGGLR